MLSKEWKFSVTHLLTKCFCAMQGQCLGSLCEACSGVREAVSMGTLLTLSAFPLSLQRKKHHQQSPAAQL